MSNEEHISVIYIKAPIDRVWEALTNAEFTRQYFHSTDIKSDWTTGSTVTFYNQDQSIAVEGTILEADKPNKLSYTWHVHYNPVAKAEEPSRVTYLLETVEDATKLTLTHDRFPAESAVYPQINEGWIAIICNMKTLLETDSVMAIS
jgi:uncharacterized protein YndB with AHSA1/START domain